MDFPQNFTTNPKVGIVCNAGKNLNVPPLSYNLAPISTGLNLNNFLISSIVILVNAEYLRKNEFIIVVLVII